MIDFYFSKVRICQWMTEKLQMLRKLAADQGDATFSGR
jgi:hypothetical protein